MVVREGEVYLVNLVVYGLSRVDDTPLVFVRSFLVVICSDCDFEGRCNKVVPSISLGQWSTAVIISRLFLSVMGS